MSASEIDYVSAHLAWAKEHSNFSPKYAQDITESETYYKSLKTLYSTAFSHMGGLENDEWFCCKSSSKVRHANLQKLAQSLYYADQLWLQNSQVISQLVAKTIIDAKKLEPTAYFVTIGFNHQTWTVDKCVKAISKLMDFDWVLRCKANFELFRENGEHPHCHFYIETYEPKSKVLEKLFRPKYIQDIVLKKSFIDIKKAELYHIDYINLVKTSGKMSFVQQDVEWREKNCIPNFEKNWNLEDAFLTAEDLGDC